MKVKERVFQSCPTLCDPKDCSLPGSSVHAILQAKILEWIVIPFSRGSSWPRDQTQVSWIAGRFFAIWATREAHNSQKKYNLCHNPNIQIKKTTYPYNNFDLYSFSYILCNLFLSFFFFFNPGHNQLNKLHNLLKGHNWQLKNAAPAPMVSILLNSNRNYFKLFSHLGFPGSSVGKESACNAGDADSILGTGRSPGGWHGNPL